MTSPQRSRDFHVSRGAFAVGFARARARELIFERGIETSGYREDEREGERGRESAHKELPGVIRVRQETNNKNPIERSTNPPRRAGETYSANDARRRYAALRFGPGYKSREAFISPARTKMHVFLLAIDGGLLSLGPLGSKTSNRDESSLDPLSRKALRLSDKIISDSSQEMSRRGIYAVI